MTVATKLTQMTLIEHNSGSHYTFINSPPCLEFKGVFRGGGGPLKIDVGHFSKRPRAPVV
jgi:hypothetical protein